MRGLGNGLAVPQALICLTKALTLIAAPPSSGLLTDLMQSCMSSRVRNDNFCLYPGSAGWCLCRLDQHQEILSLLSPASPWGQLRPRQDLRFYRWSCFDEFQSVEVVLPEGLSMSLILRAWGVDELSVSLPSDGHVLCL